LSIIAFPPTLFPIDLQYFPLPLRERMPEGQVRGRRVDKKVS